MQIDSSPLWERGKEIGGANTVASDFRLRSRFGCGWKRQWGRGRPPIPFPSPFPSKERKTTFFQTPRPKSKGAAAGTALPQRPSRLCPRPYSGTAGKRGGWQPPRSALGAVRWDVTPPYTHTHTLWGQPPRSSPFPPPLSPVSRSHRVTLILDL